MCGRFVSTASAAEIAEFFDADTPNVEFGERYNIAPTNEVYGVIGRSDAHRAVEIFEWGLIPSWAKDARIGNSLINCRAETIAEKPSFRTSFARRRCVVPMSGFYEWRAASPDGPRNAKGVPVKQPLLFERADRRLLAVAGLWSAWREPGSGDDVPWRHTCTLVTTTANSTMAAVHDRMPVILDDDGWHEWLDPTSTQSDLLMLLQPAHDDVLVAKEVSTAVNNVRNQGPFW